MKTTGILRRQEELKALTSLTSLTLKQISMTQLLISKEWSNSFSMRMTIKRMKRL
jgi:hypothetical protein